MDWSARLKALTALDLPHRDARFGAGSRPAEVLALFGETEGGEARLLYIHRAEAPDRPDRKDAHAGQMAFPGGGCEPGETDPPRGRAALRETFEEVGIPEGQIELEGFLHEIVSATGFQVLPAVGWLRVPIDRVPLKPDPREIQGTVWVPWAHLLDPAAYAREAIEAGSVRYPIHVYRYEGRRIWGLTGALTRNLIDRWRATQAPPINPA